MRQGEDLYFDALPRSHGEPLGAGSATSAGRPAVVFAFYWSHRRLRRLAFVIAALVIATLPVVLSESASARAIGLGWLLVLWASANGLARRFECREPVITIDRVGFYDSRALGGPLHWQDIGTLGRCHVSRTRVVELFLVNPRHSTAKHKVRARFGGWMQRTFGVPAVTINLLLIDASVAEVLAAIATFRPGLVPRGMLSAA